MNGTLQKEFMEALERIHRRMPQLRGENDITRVRMQAWPPSKRLDTNCKNLRQHALDPIYTNCGRSLETEIAFLYL